MSDVLNAELKALNEEVAGICAKRKAWMDEHMSDYAKFKVGDEIYERESGRLLGVVTKLYRYWGSQDDPRYDTHMSIEYEYKTTDKGYNFHDNTSRRGSYTNWDFATRAEAAEEQARKLERLRDKRTDAEKYAAIFKERA